MSRIHPGPLLFLVYVSDITSNIGSDINLFADDTSFLQILDDPVVAANILNEDLERLHQWASKWLVTFNHAKTETSTFSVKINKIVHLQPFLQGNVLKEVTHHTPLEITFSNDCSWSNDIKTVVRKASKHIGIMKRLNLH